MTAVLVAECQYREERELKHDLPQVQEQCHPIEEQQLYEGVSDNSHTVPCKADTY